MTTKVFEGRSNYSSDQIFTIENGKIYKGRSTYSSDELKNFNPVYEHLPELEDTLIDRGIIDRRLP